MSPLRHLRIFATGLAVLLWCSALQAQPALVGIDFGPTGGSTPLNWNPAAGAGTFGSLVDEAGDPVSLVLTVSGAGVDSFPVAPLPATIPQHSNNLANLGGSIYTFENSIELNLSGLSPGTDYELWVFGVRDIEGRAGPAFEQQVSVNGVARAAQSAADRELMVNSQLGSSSTALDSSAMVVQSDGGGALNIRVEDPGNLDILGGGVYLAGLAVRERDDTGPMHSIPSVPVAGLLLLSVLLAWVGLRGLPPHGRRHPPV